MKVGIITFQYAYNYGAVLQCLAMQRALEILGVNSEVINYLPPKSKQLPFWRGWGISKGQCFKRVPNRIIGLRHGTAARKRFDDFRSEYLHLSSPCQTISEVADIADQYDAIITGSDQVWHFSNQSVYFLEWGRTYAGKRISYAPSCGSEQQPKKRNNEIANWLKAFDCLSVRDECSRKVVSGLINQTPEIVADPTLLVDLSDIHKKIKLPYARYLLVYILGEEIEGGHRQIIQLIREKHGNLPTVVVIASAHKPQKFHWADRSIFDAGPREWLYLIANATFIYTDSFHGALFSMKHKKPFLCYHAEDKRSARLFDIAERYAVNSNVAGSLKEAIKKRFWNHLNYDKVNDLMNLHVETSFLYLKKALQL
jgi:hypothetical protein